MNTEDINLTDVIERETLQRIQDAFCDMTGIVVGISDTTGALVTEDKMSSDFCKNYNKKSPIGNARCIECDRMGGQMSFEQEKTVIYKCHSGMVDFAAPILAHGKKIGSITGGQVRTDELDEERLLEIAKEIEVDPQGYLEAAKKIRYIEKDELERAARFLSQIAQIISDMAYDKYSLILANEEIEHATQMKSDFLANMSHEIRTPMNAVIGMAELAMREDLPPAARNYVGQIASSGKTLLTIINDILDFSKIEAGKMTIEEEVYEPLSLVNDIANIINTRIGDKDVELVLDIEPSLPCELLGDIERLKQVIINLSNNAVKFTEKGQVVLQVGYKKIAPDTITLEVAVKDTGMGIKKENLANLFEAFTQVNSKRNRNIEGTGLGLTIAKQIINLLGGEISVESEFGKGSTFSFWIPQKIYNEKPSVVVEKKEKIKAAGLCVNDFLRKHIETDMKHLDISFFSLESEEQLSRLEEEKVTHFFVGQGMFTDTVKEFVVDHPEILTILMIDFRDSIKMNINNLLVVKKPVYVLNIASIFNGQDINTGFGYAAFEDFEFVAPEAEILIVDDNAINLTVAEGLLQPVQMKIDTALSGKEAMEKISEKIYDLVFMDHMMPEIDGVEVTRLIRRFHPEYENVPIIALTANAVSGTKEMFISEGMNDFVAKPIELRTILSKLRTWLPKDKMKKTFRMEGEEAPQPEQEVIQIEGLDTNAALKLLGTEKLFMAVLKDYYRVIEKKAKLIKQYQEAEDWKAYTVEVHALKSASKQVGAMELSEKAKRLEQAGNMLEIELIHATTDEMLEQYLSYKEILRPYFPEETKEAAPKKHISKEELVAYFLAIRDAAEELDMDTVSEILDKMRAYAYEDAQASLLEQLEEAVSEYDVDKCEETLQQWESLI